MYKVLALTSSVSISFFDRIFIAMTEKFSKFGLPHYLFLGIAILGLALLVGAGCQKETIPPSVSSDEPGGFVKPTVSPVAVERILPHRKFSGQFVTIGHGSDAKWGINKTLNFQYTVSVVAESEVLSKEKTDSGYIKVEEVRSFHAIADNLVVSDIDFQLCLDTLPIKAISNAVDFAAGFYSALTGNAAVGGIVLGAKEYLTATLRQFDGMSLRGLWGLTGVDLPEEVEKYVNKLANNNIRQAIGGMRDISGKSYKFTWYQKESGEPLQIKYSYVDGSEVTNEEEVMVLKRVNTFIDYYLAPDKDCQPGDSWNISAENLQEVFDPFVDGTYVGSIAVVRKENEGDDWKLEMLPSEIRVRSENETTGELKVTKGYATLEPKDVTLKDLFAEGTANIRKISRHHLLFTARIEGDCQFQGRLISEAVLDK